NQIPPWREWHRGRFGMDSLARHDVGQGDACGQHLHPHFTNLRLGALFFNHLKCVGPAVVGDDDARVSHEPLFPCRALTVHRDSASATASGPAGNRSCPDESFAARHTASATSDAFVTAPGRVIAAKTDCAKGAYASGISPSMRVPVFFVKPVP